MGPGTGLGGSTLDLRGGSPVARACEPGHMGLAAATALELELFRMSAASIRRDLRRAAVIWPGLQRLYQTLAYIAGRSRNH